MTQDLKKNNQTIYPNVAPGGTVGQVLTKTENGQEWISPQGGGGGDIYETVNIILSSDDESGVEIGAIVTLSYAEVTETKAYVAGGIQFKIPTSMDYIIGFQNKTGYVTPTSVTRTALPGNQITINKEYTEVTFDIVTIDQSISDPATMISGDVNGPVIQWIRANSHRFLGKYTEAGKMILCQLDDSDSRKYYDGSDAVLTGNEGDVFMKLPEFWWKSENDGTTTTVTLSKKNVDGFNKWEGDKEVLGVYEAVNSASKLYSRSGVASAGSISQANSKSCARSRGQGFTIITWEWHCIMAMLYYCLYGHMNSQAIIGEGTNSSNKITGERNSLGMADTRAGIDGDNGSINFWGLENFWGNKWEWIDNVLINASTVDHLWRITDHNGNIRSIQGYGSAASGAYVKQHILGSHFDLIPVTLGGTSTSGFCDGFYYVLDTERVVSRSGPTNNLIDGVSNGSADNTISSTHALGGSRLAFHGLLEIEDDVETFKALVPIG